MKDLHWKDYAVWDKTCIKGIFGKKNYMFLSNFHLCDVWYEGALYPSSEHAYMAAKTLDLDKRQIFHKDAFDGTHYLPTLTCAEAKRLGSQIQLREGWEDIKYDIMLNIVFNKFSNNSDIKNLLLKTGNKYLEETVDWHDNYWGNCICDKCTYIEGQNNLGHILMKVREIFD